MDAPAAEAALGPPVQIAYAVPDAVEHAHRWAALGAGPFFVRPHIALTEVVHRGEPATFDHTSAYGQWGSIMVELVQDHGLGPSVIRERYASQEVGLHHFAFFVDDLDASTAALAGAGFPLAMSAATSSGMRFHFVDTCAALGHMVELYVPTPHLVGFYEKVAAASAGWDGRDPVRMV
jgi:hypothetical protein